MLQWYCIQARPNKVFFAKSNIHRLGFETLLPTETITKSHYGVEREQLVPLFGSYFFVRFDVDTDRWKPITNTPGVRRLLSHTPEHPTPIPEISMTTMLACLIGTPPPDTKAHVIHPGAMVRIVKGPLARDDIIGYQPIGICQWKRGQRIALMLAMVNGDVTVTFDLESLELVDDVSKGTNPTS